MPNRHKPIFERIEIELVMLQTTENSAQADIMIVDDIPENLEILQEMLLKHGFSVRPFLQAKTALRSAMRRAPQMVLLDINMPEMNGYEACIQFKDNPVLKDIPILFISALNESQDKVRGFNVGGVDYITKPFLFAEVVARVKAHLEIYELRLQLKQHNQELLSQVADQIRETIDSQLATIFALSQLAENREENTGRHLERVQELAFRLASVLKQDPRYQVHLSDADIDNIRRSSPLHDIGKINIPDAILVKPGSLTPDEWEAMKRHTLIGNAMLESVLAHYPHNAFLKTGACIARSHHERWDGNGYPDRLSGDRIPLAARILAVVDAYDALRAIRPYKEPKTHADACRILASERGKHFDPVLIDAFLAHHELFENAWIHA